MLERVALFIQKNGMFEKGMHAGVAVSGGADSLCLLHLLHQLASHWNLHLSVIHIDHGLRGEDSRADAEFVRRIAGQYGLPFHLREAQVSEMDDNLEQAAREVRHGFFSELKASGAVQRVATGHTLSDQAETVLYRVLRGSGLTGLCGILPVTRAGLVRPLLEVTRAEVEDWMAAHGFAWRSDETNQHVNFARNRLRHEVMPLLRKDFNPRLDQALAHLATLASDEEQYWTTLVTAPEVRGGAVYLPIAELSESPPAWARRRVRLAILSIKGNLRQVDYLHVERILGLARAASGSGRIQLPGLDVFRSFEWLRIAPAGFDSGRPRDFRSPVTIPGAVALPGSSGICRFELRDFEQVSKDHDKVRDEIDWQRLAFPPPPGVDAGGAGHVALELRNWRPGDQYRRVGDLQGRKLKLLFQEYRIPLWERRNWPVLVSGDRILWTRQFGPAAEFAPGPGTRSVLRIQETRED